MVNHVGRAQRMSGLGDRAYAQLQGDIIEGRVGPGDRLVELDLCDKLKMGRTPIRDALRRLQGDGLVNSVPNAGYSVRSLTLDDLETSNEVRAALECLAIRLACRRGFSDVRVLELENQCDRYAEAIKEKDPSRVAIEDFRLHKLIVRLATSPDLESAVRASHMQFVTLSRSVPADVYLRSAQGVLEDHRRIVQLLRERKGEEAEQTLRDHITRRTHERLREYVRAVGKAETARNVAVLGEFGKNNGGGKTRRTRAAPFGGGIRPA